MATKKGIALTAAIIGGFVAASFLVYLIPQSPRSAVVGPSDYGEQLRFAMDRNQAVIDEFNTSFQSWKNGEIDKDTFKASANVAAEQVNMLVLELKQRQVPSEWNQSYSLFIQALENYRSYTEKTQEYADYKSGGLADPVQERTYLDAMSETLGKAQSLAQESMNAMPKKN